MLLGSGEALYLVFLQLVLFYIQLYYVMHFKLESEVGLVIEHIHIWVFIIP